MPPMWAWNRSIRLEAFAAHLGVEVQTAGLEAAHFQELQHDLRGHVNVGRELVGVPADQFVAGIGIDGAESACGERRSARAGRCGRRAWRGWFRC